MGHLPEQVLKPVCVRYHMPKITDHTYTCTHCLFADLMQGCPHTEAFSSLPPSLRGRGEDEEEEVAEQLWSLDREQAIAEMVQLCREELFPTKTLTVVGWALVEAAGYSFVEGSRKEEDCVLLQCREKNQLCVARCVCVCVCVCVPVCVRACVCIY